MAVADTYLLTAPHDMDALGRAFSHIDIIRKVKKINPRVWADLHYPPGVWWPGIKDGITSMYVGPQPGVKCPLTRKVTAFTPGMIAEHTQLDPEGHVVSLGWRFIFERLVKARVCRHADLEKAFGVSLDINKEDKGGLCPDCKKMGKDVRSTSKKGRCDMHAGLAKNVERQKEMDRHLKWLTEKGAA